ncbi:MAG: hypothetical protein PHQ60_01980 [Sideroxydans sp.]|nr:hypothetical protein [Sideroxydans sp.]MDD5056611.1 hypothetical protein [Sideroxydans sp.]
MSVFDREGRKQMCNLAKHNDVLSALSGQPLTAMTGVDLFAYLQAHGHVDMKGWYVSLNEHGVWLTNPYGVDCGLFGATEDGCQRALKSIENQETQLMANEPMQCGDCGAYYDPATTPYKGVCPRCYEENTAEYETLSALA